MITAILITVGIVLIIYYILWQFLFRKRFNEFRKKNQPLELEILLPPYKEADLTDSFKDISKTLVGRKIAKKFTYNSEPKKYVPES